MGAHFLDGKGHRIRGFGIRGEIYVTQSYRKLTGSESERNQELVHYII